VLNCIYEEEFLGFSYGFRPKRGQHDALDALVVAPTSMALSCRWRSRPQHKMRTSQRAGTFDFASQYPVDVRSRSHRSAA
jgi:hypothetical protein